MLPMHPSGQHLYVSPGTVFSTPSLFGVYIVPFCGLLSFLFLSFLCFFLAQIWPLMGPMVISLFIKRKVGIGQSAGREHVSLPAPLVHSLRNGS